MILESFREYGVPRFLRYECPDAVKPRDASYYDLIRTIHGHTPAPKLRFWKGLSIPVKELRDGNTFTCPQCGEGSFFKTFSSCNSCRDWLDWDEYPNHYNAGREKARRLLKDIECALLPLLILAGKAWYMPSTRSKFYGETLHAKLIPDAVLPPRRIVEPEPTITEEPLDKYLETG